MIRSACALAVACTALLGAACGGGGPVAANVGDETITVDDVRRAADALSAELAREGKDPIERGTEGYRRLEQQVLGVLVHRARLEQEADELGIGVSAEEVEERSELGEEEGEAGEDEQFLADQARAQILEEKLFTHVTGTIVVSDADVRAHFDRNAKTLYKGRTFDSLRDAIRSQLLSARRNASWSRWLEQVEREYASKIEYGEGYGPTG